MDTEDDVVMEGPKIRVVFHTEFGPKESIMTLSELESFIRHRSTLKILSLSWVK